MRNPIFFKRNRVFRVYKGGALFHDLLGDEKADGNFPEEWIGSVVRALNKDMSSDNEGISVTEDGVLFSELLQNYRQEMLGTHSYDVLVKYLDSAIRLPVQAHPDKAYSRKHFDSDYGKTECWIVLATREDAKLYIGFKEGVTREMFGAAVEESRTDPDAMEALMQGVAVQPGDVYLIPAKCAHAIGKGCLILEVQEPTDFTIQPEYLCGDYRLTEKEMYLGLTKEEGLDCFDFSLAGTDVFGKTKKFPELCESNRNYRKESLISAKDTPCFTIDKVTVFGSFTLRDGARLYIITKGSGEIVGDGYKRNVKQGEYFFLPDNAANAFSVCAQTEMEIFVCGGSK